MRYMMSKIDIQRWQEFPITHLFEIKKGKRLTKADMREGNINFIGASAINNGVTAKIANSEYLHSPNTITVNYNGSVGVSFYQDEQFWASDDVNVLYPLFPLNKHIAMFLIPVIQSKGRQYAFVDKWKKEYMEKESLRLPATADGKPDWQYMEQYISNKEKQVVQWLDILQNVDSLGGQRIDNQSWRRYIIGDLFEIRNGKGITQHEIYLHPGDTPAIQSGADNNGCIGYISKEYCISQRYTLSSGACLTVARSGSSGHVTFQPSQCVVGDSAKILQPKQLLSREAMLFLRSVLMVNKRKYAYSDKVTSKAYAADTILLPSTPEGAPDWTYMEEYMKQVIQRKGGCIIQMMQTSRLYHQDHKRKDCTT